VGGRRLARGLQQRASERVPNGRAKKNVKNRESDEKKRPIGWPKGKGKGGAGRKGRNLGHLAGEKGTIRE